MDLRYISAAIGIILVASLNANALAIAANKPLIVKSYSGSSEHGIIFFNPAGQRKLTYKPRLVFGQKAREHIAQYASLTFSIFGSRFPLGGINDSGLVVETVRPESESIEDFNDWHLPYYQYVTYFLDTYASAAELAEDAKKMLSENRQPPFKFYVCDKGSTCFVIDLKGASGRFSVTSTKRTRKKSLLEPYKMGVLRPGSVDGAVGRLAEVWSEGFTQWNIIYAPSAFKLYYLTSSNRRALSMISGKRLKQKNNCTTGTLYADMDSATALKDDTRDITDRFAPLSDTKDLVFLVHGFKYNQKSSTDKETKATIQKVYQEYLSKAQTECADITD